MADDRIQSPQSSAGIMRFYDVTTSKLQLDPKAVIAFGVAVIVIEIAIHLMIR